MQKLLTDIGKKSKKAINKSLSTKKKDKVLKDYRLLILKNKKLIINENKKDINLNYTKANHAFLKKEFKEAYDLYELALKDNPDNLYFLEGKARSLFRMNNFNESEKIFQEIIEKDKNSAELIANFLNDTIVINGNGLDEEY